MLLRIVAPHFVCGVVVVDRSVRRAAPIVAYMRTWQVERIRAYCARRGWAVEEVG